MKTKWLILSVVVLVAVISGFILWNGFKYRDGYDAGYEVGYMQGKAEGRYIALLQLWETGFIEIQPIKPPPPPPPPPRFGW